MPRYLLEAYIGDSATAQAEVVANAELVATLGTDIRHVRTTFVPEDQLALHVFEAPSAGALRRAGNRASLHYERLVEAYEAETGPATHNHGGVS
jgi:hypothetical protein